MAARKFARKLSLEYTQFNDLEHLVETAMAYALENAGGLTGPGVAMVLTLAFCKKQDVEREKEKQ